MSNRPFLAHPAGGQETTFYFRVASVIPHFETLLFSRPSTPPPPPHSHQVRKPKTWRETGPWISHWTVVSVGKVRSRGRGSRAGGQWWRSACVQWGLLQ